MTRPWGISPAIDEWMESSFGFDGPISYEIWERLRVVEEWELVEEYINADD